MGETGEPTNDPTDCAEQASDAEEGAAEGGLDRESLASVPAGVTMTHVLDETVLLNAESGVYYGLNDSGRRMLDLSLANGDADEVVRLLAEQLPAEPADLEADLYGLLSRLEQEGLIVVSDSIGAEVARAAELLPPVE